MDALQDPPLSAWKDDKPAGVDESGRKPLERRIAQPKGG
jgi:hypothetical protein